MGKGDNIVIFGPKFLLPPSALNSYTTPMLVTVTLALLTLLSFGLLLWQALVAWRFPLHQRVADESFAPAITLLKPLKGCDEHTADCLRSWLEQEYRGPVQILFGVARENDPVCFV